MKSWSLSNSAARVHVHFLGSPFGIIPPPRWCSLHGLVVFMYVYVNLLDETSFPSDLSSSGEGVVLLILFKDATRCAFKANSGMFQGNKWNHAAFFCQLNQLVQCTIFNSVWFVISWSWTILYACAYYRIWKYYLWNTLALAFGGCASKPNARWGPGCWRKVHVQMLGVWNDDIQGKRVWRPFGMRLDIWQTIQHEDNSLKEHGAERACEEDLQFLCWSWIALNDDVVYEPP